MATARKVAGPLSILTLAAASLAEVATQPFVLKALPTEELLDIDCLEVRSAHVDWASIRRRVWHFDALWQAPEPQALLQSCRKILPAALRTEEHVVLRRLHDAFAECALGTLSAVLLVSLCTADCSGSTGSTFSTFDDLWRALLLGKDAVPLYVLGTSAWPIASLLAKWQSFCFDSSRSKEPALCRQKEVTHFLTRAEEAAEEHLMPLLWQPREKASAAEAMLGMFVATTLRPLTTFMNSGPHAEPDFAATCAAVICAEAAVLLLIRLLGPPVSRDPLHRPRLLELTSAIAKVPLLNLTQTPVVFSAVLAVSHYVSWRSHDTFLDVKHAEVREVLHSGWAHGNVTACQSGCNLLQRLQHQGKAGLQKLWEAASSNSNLSPLWKQIARWLISLEPKNAAPVYVAVGVGAIHHRWLTYFLNRAADLRLPQVVLVTAEVEWLLACEDVRQSRKMTGLLCIRIGHGYIKPLDLHDKAKFYLFPVLLSLGMDIVSLDLDIFLFKDPTARLLEAVYRQKASPLDVAVMDHFDGTCLNAGVIFVRASDSALLWVLQYLRWMHIYPFGHYQNGLDAFLKHSVVEPQMPEHLTNVSYGVLATDLEYVTLAGWSGSMHQQRHRALLLHFASATSTGMSPMERQAQLLNLFNATARRHGEKEPDVRRMQMAKWKVLNRLKTSSQRWKTPCYVGIHSTVAQIVEAGLYEEMLS